MAHKWHYSQDGAQYGPVDESEIIRLIQNGHLDPGSPVCMEGAMAWQPARNHACFQVEIYPKKTKSSDSPAVTTPKDSAWHQGKAGRAPLDSLNEVVISEQNTAPPPPPPPPPPHAMGALCPHCNSAVPAGEIICNLCGSHIQAMPEPNKNKLIGVIAGGVAALILVSSGIYFFALKKDPSGGAKGGSYMSGARRKANRLKCANNLKSLHQSMTALSSDIDGSTPHLYGAFNGNGGNLQAKALGYSGYDDVYNVNAWMGAYTIRENLVSVNVLVSPLDPKATARAKQLSKKQFADYRDDTISIPSNAQSYALAMQGDMMTAGTVMFLTRNMNDATPDNRREYIRRWGGRNHSNYWKYPQEDREYSSHVGAAHISGKGDKDYDAKFLGKEDASYSMQHMKAGDGNWVLSDGSTMQGTTAEFNTVLNSGEDTYREGYAISTGLNLIILRPYQ